MDYLLRDSLMTGAKYGIYDLEWIINALAIDEAADRIYVEARGLYAVEEYLQARYYMFRQVYFHRTLRSAEAALRSIIRRTLRMLDEGKEVWHAPGTPFEKILRREELSITEHLQIDDSDFVFHVKQWQTSSDPILSDLSRRFTGRRLFKAIDLDMPEDQQAEFLRRRGRSSSRPASTRNIILSKTARAICRTTTTTPRRRRNPKHTFTSRVVMRRRRSERSVK